MRTLEAVLDEMQAKLPAKHVVQRVFRQTDFIRNRHRVTCIHALRDGGIWSSPSCSSSSANLRAAFITLTAIPLSLLAAVLTLQAFGATINTMTLGGMAIAIGALVS